MSIAAQLERNLRDRCARNLPNITDRMVSDTRQATSRRSGALAESIGADPWTDQGSRYVSTIRATAEYARYQEEGTGIFGPTGQRIAPRSAKVLRFDWPAAGGIVFARSVAGSPGRHFMFGEDGREMQRRFVSAFDSVWTA